MREYLLEVRDLKTYFASDKGVLRAVDGVSFSLAPGEALGIVGESGCGKSVTARSIMRLIDYPGKIVGGQILYRGDDLLAKSEAEMRKYRGGEIAMIFQDPLTTLNPVLKVGEQISESIRLHYGDFYPRKSWRVRLNPFYRRRWEKEIWERSVEMLEQVGISAPSRRMMEYPHQLSGGMRQRVMIAIALSCHPALLIADEPTTALDVTIQAQILELMTRLRKRFDMSVILITHDLGVVAEFCDRVAVMYAGKIVEQGTIDDILFYPQHPYTKGLLKSVPRIGDKRYAIEPIPGVVPELHELPSGCRFSTRCRWVTNDCRTREPALARLDDHHYVSCFRVSVQEEGEMVCDRCCK